MGNVKWAMVVLDIFNEIIESIRSNERKTMRKYAQRQRWQRVTRISFVRFIRPTKSIRSVCFYQEW